MADITEQHDQTSPNELDDQQANGAAESRGVKRQRQTAPDDDDDDDDKGGRERRKIEIKFISDKSRRHITFSKRKAGIMKKVSRRVVLFSNGMRGSTAVCPLLFPIAASFASAGVLGEPSITLGCMRATANLRVNHQAYELSVLTGTQVLLLVVSETGLVYTFTTPKLQPLVTKAEGKNLIQVRLLWLCTRLVTLLHSNPKLTEDP